MKCCAKREVERGLTLSFTRDLPIKGDSHPNTETEGRGAVSKIFFSPRSGLKYEADPSSGSATVNFRQVVRT